MDYGYYLATSIIYYDNNEVLYYEVCTLSNLLYYEAESKAKATRKKK